jgi:glycosidase
MRKQRLVIPVFLFIIWGSVSSKAHMPFFQPVRLQYDTTVIHLSDFLLTYDKVRKIECVSGLHAAFEKDGKVLLWGKPSTAVSLLRIFTLTNTLDLVCFKSKKIRYEVPELRIPLAAEKASLKGSFNGWVSERNPLQMIKPGAFRSKPLILDEGYHPFKLDADGKELNPIGFDTIGNGMGGFNAIFKVGNPEQALPILQTMHADKGTITVSLSADITHWLCYWNNRWLPSQKKGNTLLIQIPSTAQLTDRSYIRVYACNTGKPSNDLLIPLQRGLVIQSPAELNRADVHTSIMYFLMVDRFADGNATNNKPIQDPAVLPQANFMGGDLQGITSKLHDGFFRELGINTLWISPILKNPDGAWGYWNKGVKTKFSGYHGYWPVSYSQVDPHFGDSAALVGLLSTAHQSGTSVLLDYVAHHVHQEHPFIHAFPDAATPLYLPDGRMNTELWDEQRLTTWFDTFLPTLNLQADHVRKMAVDSAVTLFRRYPFDGFRHDATKHVPEQFWRDLTYRLKTDPALKNKSLYQIGETYGSAELIGSYVGNGLLDAQFDFNLYDAAVATFSAPEGKTNFSSLVKTFQESTGAYGWHHVMGNISGNQDRPRFISLADGSLEPGEDMKLAGYMRKIDNKSTTGYQRLAQLMAFNMTIPGIPVIYYGDEIGMPGANDPDNRHMMIFTALHDQQKQLREKVKQLIALRKSNMALLFGEMTILRADSVLMYSRQYFGKTSLVIFSDRKTTVHVPVSLPPYATAHFGHAIDNRQINLNAGDFEIITY